MGTHRKKKVRNGKNGIEMEEMEAMKLSPQPLDEIWEFREYSKCKKKRNEMRHNFRFIYGIGSAQ